MTLTRWDGAQAEPFPAIDLDGGLTLTEAFGDLDIAKVQHDINEAMSKAVADTTRKAYASDWKRFDDWCALHNASPLPAHPAVVATYLHEAAYEKANGGWKYKMATLDRWLTSINVKHDHHGLPRPTRDERLNLVVKGLKRDRGARQKRAHPLLLEDLRHILEGLDYASWPYGLAAARDAALLLIGFTGAFRRSEIAALPCGSIRMSPAEGAEAILERSKTDQEAEGQIKALPYGRAALTCPPCVLWRWINLVLLADDGASRSTLMKHLRASPPRDEHICRDDLPDLFEDSRPIFRAITKGGLVGATALTGHSVNTVVKKRVAQVGLNPKRYSGHSLRSGLVTELFRRGQDGHAIARQTGHRNLQTLEIYFRENAPFVGNAVTTLDL